MVYSSKVTCASPVIIRFQRSFTSGISHQFDVCSSEASKALTERLLRSRLSLESRKRAPRWRSLTYTSVKSSIVISRVISLFYN